MTTPLDTSLVPVDASLVPASIRSQGTKAVTLYQTALQFEQLLTQQLAQSIVPDDADDAASDDAGDDSSSQASGLGAYQGLLPDALAQSVTGAGGIGLALDLYRSLGGAEEKPS